MTNEEMLRTLLMATYVIPNVDSFLPISTQALFKVNPDFYELSMPKQVLKVAVAFHALHCHIEL